MSIFQLPHRVNLFALGPPNWNHYNIFFVSCISWHHGTQLWASLIPLGFIVPWYSRDLMGSREWPSMMPREACLSVGSTPDFNFQFQAENSEHQILFLLTSLCTLMILKCTDMKITKIYIHEFRYIAYNIAYSMNNS